jgi:NitT/TauT family transport system substrate-binding protein
MQQGRENTNMKKIMVIAAIALFLGFGLTANASAAQQYTIAWSHYTGWEPYQYMQDSGILVKWAKKYGVDIRVQLFDYMESMTAFTTGNAVGCVMTNMDALMQPAAAGVDTAVIIIGDYSNGNDGAVILNGKSFKDLKGREVRLVENSVSHYLLSRGLEMNGMKESDLRIMNVSSEADISNFLLSEKNPAKSKAAVVTWNPVLMNVRSVKGSTMVFDSSKIPGEILDCLVVRADTPDAVKKAMVGAWFETMAVMASQTKEGKNSLEQMAKSANCTLAMFMAQLKTTYMYYNPADAASYAQSGDLKKIMDYIREFLFSHGVYGTKVTKDKIGIQFPDKTIIGDPKNVKLRFDANYMQMAADKKL